ncbi:hypothetical protein [Thalassobellus suaedae]|uniref:Uncharacterized protein n=1 Tax=Thalassobellus suaedae TaxID=3074124 RepID=A0ABY9Y1Y9_9FLAO|nr:hypothetical protein RHP49_15330 [Flavobacteriaceae bacterium HL-DH10]
MKTKKFIVAIAIFGGMLFMAQAVNAFNVDGQQTVKVKKNVPIPRE